MVVVEKLKEEINKKKKRKKNQTFDWWNLNPKFLFFFHKLALFIDSWGNTVSKAPFSVGRI